MRRRAVTWASLDRVPDWVLHQDAWTPPADLDVTPGPTWVPRLGGEQMHARLVTWRAWSDARREWLDAHAPGVSHRALIAERRRRFPTVSHPSCPDTARCRHGGEPAPGRPLGEASG